MIDINGPPLHTKIRLVLYVVRRIARVSNIGHPWVLLLFLFVLILLVIVLMVV